MFVRLLLGKPVEFTNVIDSYVFCRSPHQHQQISPLGGGFKDFLFLPLPGEMIQFDEPIFQMGGQKTTN